MRRNISRTTHCKVQGLAVFTQLGGPISRNHPSYCSGCHIIRAPRRVVPTCSVGAAPRASASTHRAAQGHRGGRCPRRRRPARGRRSRPRAGAGGASGCHRRSSSVWSSTLTQPPHRHRCASATRTRPRRRPHRRRSGSRARQRRWPQAAAGEAAPRATPTVLPPWTSASLSAPSAACAALVR